MVGTAAGGRVLDARAFCFAVHIYALFELEGEHLRGADDEAGDLGGKTARG